MTEWESIIILALFVFLENAIYCLIKLVIFADIVHQEGTISINNIQTQYPETPKCLKLWR